MSAHIARSPCYCCKLDHPRVEAAGMWHCPNPICPGPGAAYFRSTLTSYRVINDHGRHEVDDAELQAAGRRAIEAMPEGELRAALMALNYPPPHADHDRGDEA